MKARVVALVALAAAVTGEYAGVVWKGRNGHAGLGSPWYARYEGFLTLP